MPTWSRCWPTGRVPRWPKAGRWRPRPADASERDAVVDELRQLSEDQRELLDQFARLETRERSLLAEVIHDEPIQLIVAAILRIDLLSARSTGAGADTVELDRIATLLETSVDRLRRLIVALMPPDLTDGLGAALRDLAGGIFVGTTTLFHPTARCTCRSPYRRRKRRSGSCARHWSTPASTPAPSNVTLRLDQRDAACVLTLTDDGIGSDTLDVVPGHLGMATMRARANAEGGRLRWTACPDRAPSSSSPCDRPAATRPTKYAR